MTLPPPSGRAPKRRLGKYDLLEEIGHGGMATVYRGYDPRLQRDVAVKVIHPHLRENAEVAKRFVSEARAVAMLRHPNIVEIFDVSDEGERERFLVAELVAGGNLRKLLQERGALPAEVAAAVGVELAAALEHAHAKGVVHRDVKAENVLFGRAEAPPSGGGAAGRAAIKLTDFGIAKMLDQQGVTATGQVLGSPAYMAPEQIEGGTVDERSDVFSLGVLLYEAMTGRLPFQGNNPAQVLRRVLDGTFTPADVERPTVGAAWAQVLGRALAHEPSERYPSMGELRAALEGELGALGLGAPVGEIGAFFDDPDGYERALGDRLVPRLLARGKAAHRAGNVVATAGHFNRALAFRPDDPALLALVTGFARRQARRLLARRAALAALALGTAGSAAGLTVRMVRQARGDSLPLAAASAPPSAPAPPPPDPDPPPPSASAAAPPPTPPTAAARPAVTPSSPARAAPDAPATGTRAVAFKINPQSSLVSIDGGPVVDAFTLMTGQPRQLSVGNHTIAVTPPPGSKCCEPLAPTSFQVPASADPGETLSRSFELRYNAATLVSEGPPTAQIVCPGTRVKGSAEGSYTVEMRKFDDRLECTLFREGEAIAHKKVDLRAGETTRVVWGAVR
jgi:serine/threonine-protein kinase